MNTRIKALEQQCWSHRVNGVLVDGHLHFDTEKFAELIVRECIWAFGQTRTEPSLEKYILDRLGIRNEQK